jgi:hypothetical protein
MNQRMQIVLTRTQIVGALMMLKTLGKPGAYLIGKAEKHIAGFLEKFPQSRFQLTVEALDDEAKETPREVITSEATATK